MCVYTGTECDNATAGATHRLDEALAAKEHVLDMAVARIDALHLAQLVGRDGVRSLGGRPDLGI